MSASNVRKLAPLVAVAFAASSFAAAAQAADPTMSDCITANESAGKLQADKKLRQAREQAAMCAAEACPTELHDTCRQRVADLNKSIPTIVFHAKNANGGDLTAVKVSMDGQVLAERLEGTAISVDPGQHTFRFETVGQSPIEQTLLVQEGEKDRAVSVAFGEGPAPASPPVAPAPATGTTSSAPSQPSAPFEEPQEAPNDGHTQRTIGLVVGGVGAASVIAGAVFGGLSMSAHSSYEQNCGSSIGAPAGECNAQGVSGQSDAATKGTLSTVFLVGGGVALAAGAVLFFTAPKATPASVQVGAGLGSVAIQGRF